MKLTIYSNAKTVKCIKVLGGYKKKNGTIISCNKRTKKNNAIILINKKGNPIKTKVTEQIPFKPRKNKTNVR
jgi:ribosomal protein L14